MKKKIDFFKIIINFLIIISITIESGITIGYYMLTKIDYNKYKEQYKMEVAK